MSLHFDTEFRSDSIVIFGESGTVNMAISEIGSPSRVNKSCIAAYLIKVGQGLHYPINFDACTLKYYYEQMSRRGRGCSYFKVFILDYLCYLWM